GIKNNVIFFGAVPNAYSPKFYATAGIFIGPSVTVKGGDTEGLGLTFIEASFSGCIPIGTRVGGISDVIKNGETGFLVPEKDPAAIAKTAIELLKTKKMMREMKEKTREANIKMFDWNVVTE